MMQNYQQNRLNKKHGRTFIIFQNKENHIIYTLLNSNINMQDQNSRPLSPSQLLEKFMNTDFKEAECVDQVAKFNEEKNILLSLIHQYKLEICGRTEQAKQLQCLLQTRNTLIAELKKLRDDRITIDKNLENQITNFKLTSTEVAQINQWRVELNELRFKNFRLSARFQELSDYTVKMENQNRGLEEERCKFQRRQIPNPHYCEDWKLKLRALKESQQNFSYELMKKMKEKEQSSLLQIKQQEAKIKERNRIRMENLCKHPSSVPIPSRYL